MHQRGHLLGERLLRRAGSRVGLQLGFKCRDLFLRQERQRFEQLDDVGVVCVDEELVEAVRAGFLGVEPDGAGGGLAVFGAVGLGQQREDEAPDGGAEFLAREFGADGDIAPLVGRADLQLAIERLAEVAEIVSLQQHVAELGETDAAAAVFHPRADGILCDHGVDGDVLAGVAEELEKGDRADPVVIIDHAGRILRPGKIEETGELRPDAGEVVFELLGRKEVALVGLPGGIAHHAGGPTGEGDRIVAVKLETPQREKGHQIADVQAVGRGVEAAIKSERTVGEAFGQRISVGAIGVKAAPLEFFQDRHGVAVVIGAGGELGKGDLSPTGWAAAGRPKCRTRSSRLHVRWSRTGLLDRFRCA